jgi:exodeoxyribonuclease VII small subunit
MVPSPPPPNELSFEEALRQLEEVVGALEAGQVPLERSLELLQSGLRLADRCDATLRQAELVLEELVMTTEGELIARDTAGEAQ